MKGIGTQIVRGLVRGFWFVVCTWLFFGPVGGFHHMFRYGVTTYIFLNGEDPRPGHPMWGDYEVVFSPGRFAVAVILWAFTLFVIFKWLKYLDSKPSDC